MLQASLLPCLWRPSAWLLLSFEELPSMRRSCCKNLLQQQKIQQIIIDCRAHRHESNLLLLLLSLGTPSSAQQGDEKLSQLTADSNNHHCFPKNKN